MLAGSYTTFLNSADTQVSSAPRRRPTGTDVCLSARAVLGFNLFSDIRALIHRREAKRTRSSYPSFGYTMGQMGFQLRSQTFMKSCTLERGERQSLEGPSGGYTQGQGTPRGAPR